jgi:hypothetical protein
MSRSTLSPWPNIDEKAADFQAGAAGAAEEKRQASKL